MHHGGRLSSGTCPTGGAPSTLPPPTERVVKVLLNGLPADTPTADLLVHAKSKGRVTQVNQALGYLFLRGSGTSMYLNSLKFDTGPW